MHAPKIILRLRREYIYVSHLLDLTLTTTLNVVNAGLVTQHKLPIAP